MGDVLVFLMLMAYLAALCGLAWVLVRAGSRYVTRKLGRVVVGSVKDDLMSGAAGIGSGVSGLVGCLGGLIGCLLSIALALIALFFVFWLVKRMWEVA
jgi:hypothetical protein